jgi:5-methylcytosine-specific restriction endonuclease McrA
MNNQAKKQGNLRYTNKKRQRAREYLGARCVKCGSQQELHFDHIDPKTKLFTIGKNYNLKWEVLQAELDKCQLLCKICHKKKTDREESSGGHNKWEKVKHGTLWAYTGYKCRCDLCVAAKSKYRASGV